MIDNVSDDVYDPLVDRSPTAQPIPYERFQSSALYHLTKIQSNYSRVTKARTMPI